ncbi:hypothetical protein J4Q44_G00210370, partial [Coregonus suidteri]
GSRDGRSTSEELTTASAEHRVDIPPAGKLYTYQRRNTSRVTFSSSRSLCSPATMKTAFVLLLTAALQLATFWGTNGDLVSKAPCRPGFSQSSYFMLISRDVLRSQSILKGK